MNKIISNTERFVSWAYRQGYTSISCVVLDLVQAGGLTDLLVIVGVVFPGGQLQERLRNQLTLIVPGPSHSLVELEDGIAHVDVGRQTLCLGLSFIVVHGP